MMKSVSSLLLLLVVALLLLVNASNAVMFELMSLPKGGVANKRCFSMYIGKDVTNVGKYSVSTDDPGSGQMRVGIEVKDNDGNMLYSNNNIQNKNKFSFTTHTYSDYRICFENVLDSGVTPSPTYKRTIKFDMSVGPNANDYVAELKQEHLKPIEVDLRVLEAQMDTIVKEMDYLKEREISMRDTNESTNERVQWLSLLSMLTLVGSGLWQLVYLRQFFKSKKLL